MNLRPVLILTIAVLVFPACASDPAAAEIAPSSSKSPPLKEAKLNIEHNVTDGDTGFQGAIDSEGWQSLVVTGPAGDVLTLTGHGALGELGLTELFFETVEPANADIPISDVLKVLPEGEYTISGPAIEAGESKGQTSGTAWLTHTIPAGPVLLSPGEDEVIDPQAGLLMSWEPVTQTIDGSAVEIIAYQLIIEKDEEPQAHMIGKFGLSIYLAPSVTHITVPAEFFEPGTNYKWEVLAIETSGNQTLASSTFSTR